MNAELEQADGTVFELENLLIQAKNMRTKIRQSIQTPVKHVTVKQFCEYSGYSESAVAKKRSDGVWLQGEIWTKAKDGRILMNIEGYHQWVEAA